MKLAGPHQTFALHPPTHLMVFAAISRWLFWLWKLHAAAVLGCSHLYELGCLGDSDVPHTSLFPIPIFPLHTTCILPSVTCAHDASGQARPLFSCEVPLQVCTQGSAHIYHQEDGSPQELHSGLYGLWIPSGPEIDAPCNILFAQTHESLSHCRACPHPL